MDTFAQPDVNRSIRDLRFIANVTDWLLALDTKIQRSFCIVSLILHRPQSSATFSAKIKVVTYGRGSCLPLEG
jgi:hypothetical protein